MYFVLRNRKCFNFRFFVLCKTEETRDAMKNRSIVGEDGGHVVIQNKGGHTWIYKSLFNQEQSQRHAGSIILQHAVRSVTFTPYILPAEASERNDEDPTPVLYSKTERLSCASFHSVCDTRRKEAIRGSSVRRAEQNVVAVTFYTCSPVIPGSNYGGHTDYLDRGFSSAHGAKFRAGTKHFCKSQFIIYQ